MTAKTQAARLRGRLREIASSPYGLKDRDLHERMQRSDRKMAREQLKEMLAVGKLIERDGRFFISEAAAQAWAESGRRDRPVIRKEGLVSIGESQPGSGWRVQTPPPRRTQPLGAPKVTVLPAPKFDARFQVDPAERVPGGFASMGVGRYLP